MNSLEGAVETRTVEMASRVGLQGSGSARVALAASQFHSEILLVCHDCSADAKDVMAVMRLSARAGTKVTIQAAGPDEVAAVQALAALLAA
ncbi:HPr family phosphocarrier protein [Cupriavidus pinatubonensis]|uniref:HPr family phosphocarrier protein n=1 Tax=Cupriavidus pinatubonensis TaxID=248026 RepID=UPI003145422A